MPQPWPLTGRGEEVALINEALHRDAGPRGIVLAGSAGVGKTRLARHVVAAETRSGALTRWVAATAAARTQPLGAFASLVGEVGAGTTRVLPQALQRLTSGSGGAAMAFGIDDAHLLDPLSAALVGQLVLARDVAVVVTVRSGEPAPDAVTALWKDGVLDRLEVQSLAATETVALLETVLGGPLAGAAADRLISLTRGNVLYLRVLVEGERDAGRLRRQGGVWTWARESALPPRLIDLVDVRLGRLSDPVLEVIDLLALSEPLGAPLLRRLVDPAALEEAESAGLIAVEQDGRRLDVRLAHPLYGEARRIRMGRLRERRLRGRLTTAWAGIGIRRAGDTLRLAMLSVDSDREPDPALLTAAARSAIGLFDIGLAERLARHACRDGGTFEARFTHALALSWLGRAAEADDLLAALAADTAPATPAADTAQAMSAAADTAPAQARVLAAVTRACNLFWPGRDPGLAYEVLQATEAVALEPGQRRVILAARAAFHAYQGRCTQAAEDATQALEASDLPDELVVLATYGLVGGLGAGGRADAIGTAASRGFTAASRSFAAAIPSWGLCDLYVHVLRLAGYLAAAEDAARRWHRNGSQMPGPVQEPLGLSLVGSALVASGRLRSGIRSLREAQAGLGPVAGQAPGYRNDVALAMALAMAGAPVDARRSLEAAERGRHPSLVLLDPDVLLGHAWVAAAEGAVSEAIRMAVQAADLAAQRDQPAYEVFALHQAVRFGAHEGAARLAELSAQVDGPRAPAAAAHAAALAADDAYALLAAASAADAFGDRAAAADATAHASAAFDRQGRRAAATASAARAHALAQACESARSPALAAAAQPLPLTSREREIVTLAARGWSNRRIADRLVVSVRTIEGHLYRASAKLGVSDRADLVALVSPDVPTGDTPAGD